METLWKVLLAVGGLGTVIAALGFLANLYRLRRDRRRPGLAVTVRCTGGSSNGLTFTVRVSETRNQVPATDVVLTAELEGVGEVYRSPAFSLSAGQLDHPVRFTLPPSQGELVKACNDEATTYGRKLTVRVKSSRASAGYTWAETKYDAGTDRARYEAMQAVWRDHGKR